MSDSAQAAEFDPVETGRIHARELINTLAKECHTAEAFIESRTQVRRALLEALDTVDPAQIVEDARQNALSEEIQRRVTGESEQCRKDRGSLQDPLYPPTHPKQWD